MIGKSGRKPRKKVIAYATKLLIGLKLKVGIILHPTYPCISKNTVRATIKNMI
tara:strand:+ start:130 stop:288 length:159 start_codon:yes stop_codon:yes gene_type:complete